MSERKIDKVKWALYRTVTEATPAKMSKAKWIVYGAVAVSSMVLFACDGPQYPKVPRNLGD